MNSNNCSFGFENSCSLSSCLPNHLGNETAHVLHRSSYRRESTPHKPRAPPRTTHRRARSPEHTHTDPFAALQSHPNTSRFFTSMFPFRLSATPDIIDDRTSAGPFVVGGCHVVHVVPILTSNSYDWSYHPESKISIRANVVRVARHVVCQISNCLRGHVD